MDKISVVSSFQKSIEALKNTECSQKEKLAHFANISDFITSPSTQNHPNQIKYVSNSLAVLLMFCEEMDSTIHLNAEENLNKIIRFCEKTFIVRIQYDLYHEIKKNGNERSLRICLNIFAYYCHLIKQRKVKPYATNFLPCIYSISKRKETQLIETLCEFLKTFGKIMEGCLPDRDILKLIEVFIGDTTSECAIKRRCASQNVMTLIINSKKPAFMCRQAFHKSLDILAVDQSVNTVIGVLGLLRLLIPQLTSDTSCDFIKIIEILDVCLQLLHDKSHSVINASLEVIHAILQCPQNSFKSLLTSLDHIGIIRKEDALRNVIFKKNGSKGSLLKPNEIDQNYFEMSSSRDLGCSSFSRDTQILDEGCLSCTDIEMDSLKSIDSSQEMEKSTNKPDAISLKSQKSTESFGSFFNSFLTQSKPTETMSKFFRSQGSSLNNTPKKTNVDDSSSFKSYHEDDVLSVKSLDSHISIHSGDSSPVVIPGNEADETITFVEIVHDSLPDQSPPVHKASQLPTETCKLDESTESIKTKEISIGSIYDQFLIDYVVRLVCYKFLLGGQDQQLQLDNVVRVSIKNLSLIVLLDCVRIRPQALSMKLTRDISSSLEFPAKASDADVYGLDICDDICDDISDLCLSETKKSNKDNLLDIKPDHFGENSYNIVEFLAPLSEPDIVPSKVSKDSNNSVVSRSSFIDNSNDLKVEKSDQSVQDVLLYFNHPDPSLRGNIQSIIGQFLFALMKDYQNVNEFREKYCSDIANKFIDLDLLLKVLIQGLSDEIHTVIKHSLSSIHLVFSSVLSIVPKPQSETNNLSFQKPWKINDLNDCSTELIRFDQILNELLFVSNNKNWVVQSKYCELVADIDFNEIRRVFGDDFGLYYERKFLDSIYSLIGDQDSRTRSSAISSLCRYIKQDQHDRDSCDQNVAIGNFVCSRVFNGLPMPFEDFEIDKLEETKRRQIRFATVLYTLSNKLLELSDRNQQFGVISAVAELVKIFNPIKYHAIWNAFNVFEICLNFMNENYAIATDASCQSDLIEICTSLLAGNAFDLNYKWLTEINTLLRHILKLLNIFNHVFNNIRPLYIPKGQKNDIFISTKEFQMFDSFGYFGNDYLYRKIYKVMQQCFESYKISIAKSSGQVVIDFLTKTLNSFIVILEIKIPELTSNPIKLIEETLTYLSTLMNYAPKESVIAIRQLLKYMFSMNLRSHEHDFKYLLENVIQNECSRCDVAEVTTVLRNLSNSSASSENAGAHISLFKPIVIRCLKIFSKSDSSIQSAILDMLCQALEFNVNYSLLDANNVFLDFVLKLLELIETGTVRASEVVVPSIIKFLFCLTKEKDRKLITIPKIINITDTLLANNVKSGSQALNELAFKFFFEDGFCDDTEFSIKDINTQKEVALRMMIKFLDVKEIQKTLCIIFMLQGSTASDNENSFYVNLLQVIEDSRELLVDDEHFVNMELCLKILSQETVMEESNLRKAFSIVCSFIDSLQKQNSIEKIFVISMLLENVLSKIDEESLLNETQQYLNEHSMHSSSASSFVTKLIFRFIKSVFDLYVEDQHCKHISTLLRKLLNIQFGLVNCNGIKNSLATEFANDNIVSTYLNKLDWSLRKPFIEFLSVINYDRLQILQILVDIKDPAFGTYVNAVLKVAIEDVDEQEVNFVIKNLDTLLCPCQMILAKVLNSPKYIDDLIDGIDVLLEGKLSKEGQQAIHNLLASCDILESYPRVIETSLKLVNLSKFLIFKMQTKKLIFEKLTALAEFKTEITKILPEQVFSLVREFCEVEQVDQSLTDLISNLQQFFDASVKDSDENDICNLENTEFVDGSWLMEQINYNAFNATVDNKTLAELLFEVTSEKQLSIILSSSKFNICHLHKFIKFSFEFMENTFKHDCMQFNPHLNYLKIPLLLKYSLTTLMGHIKSLNELLSIQHFDEVDILKLINEPETMERYKSVVEGLISFLECLVKLEHTCITFIELKLIEKYFKQNLLKEEFFETLVHFGTICLFYVTNVITNVNMTAYGIGISFKCADLIFQHNWLWNVLNSEKYAKNVELIVDVLYKTIKVEFGNSNLMCKFEIENLLINATSDVDKKAAFIAKFVELRNKKEVVKDYFKLEEVITNLIVSVLRTSKFYIFAIAPIEVLGFDLDISKSKLTEVPSIPIEYLNDADVLELFVTRIQIFGYTSRHQFEEFFMSLLVLFNTEVHVEIVDESEQYLIRNMCMTAIIELLISLKVTTNLGRTNNKFHHLPRGPAMKLTTISRNKLHKVLLKLPGANVFYLPNTERIRFESKDDITSTENFLKNQLDLDCVWQMVEEMDEKKLNLSLRNSQHLLEMSGIDFKSSFQLIFDVFGQLIETNYSLIFPHLVKLCEICENREQYRWIKDISLKMQEVVPTSNVAVHECIIYCLCKSSAILIPSLSELTSLCSLMQAYLKSSYICIRNATLKGLLCLLESCVKTNTTIGSLSEELSLIRNVIIHYTNHNGIAEESKFMFSDEHTKLVWSLNLYLIETTAKFVNDNSIISNTVISANNILKRTNNLDQYLCILHGLQRLVVANVDEIELRNKIEKISLHLFKRDNEAFSIPALKLLITCLYISSNDQLKNTENSNGIVQDEPEVILQSTERIDVLFQRIKYSTPKTGAIYGNVLCQMIRDLVPPNEILTKVIKEFLVLDQPQCEVIARILFQVFRSAIDSASLTLLQEWLICSFPNFFMCPVNKAVWSLNVILVSASINQYLVKIFPEIIENVNILNDRQTTLFRLCVKDFYSRLNGDQRSKFNIVLSNCNYEIIKNALN